MARKMKTKIPGRGAAKFRLTFLLIFAIFGGLISVMTLPDYMERLGAARAIPEAFGGCAVLFLVGAFFWGLIKWIGWMGKKSFAAARWFLEHWPVFTVIGLVMRLPIAMLIALVPPMLFGLLFSPLYLLTFHFASEGIGFFTAIALFLASSVLVLGMLIWDIRFLARTKVRAQ